MSSFLVAPPFCRASVVVSFVAATGNSANQTSYTFTDHAIGTAVPGRRILVFCSGAGSGETYTATIGGNSMTNIAAVGGSMASAFLIRQVDTGTTATIVITADSGISNCGIGVWALYGLQSETAIDTASSTATTTAVNLSVDIVAGGAAFMGRGMTAGAVRTSTWSGGTMGESFELTSDTFNGFSSAGHAIVATNAANQTYTHTASSTLIFGSAAAVSLR